MKSIKTTSIWAAGLLALALWGCAATPPPIIQNTNPPPPRKEYPVGEEFTILPDRVTQGEDKEAWVVSPGEIRSTYGRTERKWILGEDISELPQLSMPGFPMMEALYNMALEESILDINQEEQVYFTGAKWTGVWTRDISYAIHLGLGMIHPQISINSLRRKVNEQEMIIQDTGTGGSWPISTDRVVWSIAAWDIYKITGDREWLEYAHQVIANTVARDRIMAFDTETGLYFGESSFMDWREQSYPEWFSPTQIFESKSLSTNVAHVAILDILGAMSAELGVAVPDGMPSELWSTDLQSAINDQMWMEDNGYYTSYLYPNIMGGMQSHLTDSLGEALSVLTGVAQGERANQVIENMPVVYYGVPSLYPQLRGIRPYHNKGIWPFVVAYYTWAGAETDNAAAVDLGIRSLTRAAALFRSHFENMVYDNGHNEGTAVNSERQLWSVGGYLSLVYRILLGMSFESDGLYLDPMVPEIVGGEMTLSQFPVRDALLSFQVTGSGSQITEMSFDGEAWDPNAPIPYDLTGEHLVEITLAGDELTGQINMSPVGVEGPNDPRVKNKGEGAEVLLDWNPVTKGHSFQVYRNGEMIAETQETEYTETLDADRVAVYSVLALSEEGISSNFSEYVVVDPSSALQVFQLEDGEVNPALVTERPRAGEVLKYVDITLEAEDTIMLDFEVPEAGDYLLRFYYTNENGPVNTDNKCAIRTLSINGEVLGKAIFPQRGGMNQRFGYSNSLPVSLDAGTHQMKLEFTETDYNMNIYVNQAVLDHLEVLRL